MPFGEIVRISAGGGSEPVWSPDGSQLYYRDAARGLLVTPMKSGKPVGASSRVPFDGQLDQELDTNYDVAPDGQRLIVNLEDATAAPSIVVVENWIEEWRQRLPGN